MALKCQMGAIKTSFQEEGFEVKSDKKYLICKRVTHYDQLDEEAFFEWIKKLDCIERFEGIRDELYLDFVDRDLEYDYLKELCALFNRYKIGMKQLGRFIFCVPYMD